jgi:penicillin G amidase
METASRGHRFAFIVLAVCSGLVVQTSFAPASTIPCLGDCAGDERVTVDDLIKGVNIALGTAEITACTAFDLAGDGSVTVDELVKGVNEALSGCFETVALPDLPAGVEVVYDSIGIPHIYGPDLNSVSYTQGYVHAAHRFWKMDVARRWSEGRLSELFGATSLVTDVAQRTLLTTRDGRRMEEALWERIQATDPEVAAEIESYAAGVNAWLANLRAGRNGATLPPEYAFFLIRKGPEDLALWRPQDTIAFDTAAWWDMDSWILSDTMSYAELWETLDEATRKDVLRPAPFIYVPIVPDGRPLVTPLLAARASVPPALPRPGVAGAVRRHLDEVARTSPLGGGEPGAGCNSWAVAPFLSDSGSAMLAADVHFPLSNAPAYFLQQLDVASDPPMRVSGAANPGSPILFRGYNDSGAWASTTAYFDNVDVYVETITTPPDYPTSPRTVLFNGEQIPVLRIEENFLLNGGDVLTYPIEVVPHHGPMLPDPSLYDAEEGLAATGMTIRWTGQEMSNDFRTYLGLMRAQNADEFRAALRSPVRAVGPNNYVWADVHGDIAYSPYARLPQRPAGTVPWGLMPGTGEAEWLTDAEGNVAWIPEEEFPQGLNPAQGFMSTANNDPSGHTFDNDPLNDGAYFAAWHLDGLRQQRIQDMLSNRAGLRPEGAKMTMADMSAYQYDTSSLDAVRLLPFLFTAAEARPELITEEMSDAIGRLEAWMEEKPGSPACDAVLGIDAHELRADVPPRAQPVTDEEREDAVASSIYNAWVKQIWEVVPPPEWPQAWVILPWRLVLHLLEDIDQTDPAFQVYTKGPSGDSTLWDDPATAEVVETRTEVLLGALSRALDLLEQKFGSPDMSTWVWGKLHQVRLKHAIGLGYDLGPFPVPGGSWTVNNASTWPWRGGSASDFTVSLGVIQRLVVQLDPVGIKATDLLAGGQNGDPGDWKKYNQINPAIHYGDMIPKWINGETYEMRISRAAVAADNQRHVKFVPAEK